VKFLLSYLKTFALEGFDLAGLLLASALYSNYTWFEITTQIYD
jgi:hypothetical protein